MKALLLLLLFGGCGLGGEVGRVSMVDRECGLEVNAGVVSGKREEKFRANFFKLDIELGGADERVVRSVFLLTCAEVQAEALEREVQILKEERVRTNEECEEKIEKKEEKVEKVEKDLKESKEKEDTSLIEEGIACLISLIAGVAGVYAKRFALWLWGKLRRRLAPTESDRRPLMTSNLESGTLLNTTNSRPIVATPRTALPPVATPLPHREIIGTTFIPISIPPLTADPSTLRKEAIAKIANGMTNGLYVQ